MPAGTAVHLAAAADGQASFRGWSGACNGTGGCDLTPNADISVAAAFDPPAVAPPPPGKTTWLLTVTLHGSGSVKSDPAGIDCPDRCAARFDDQALVHLTANPAPGFTLGASVGAVRMSADATVDVTFTPAMRTLTVSITGDGTGGRVKSTPAGIDCPGICSLTLPYGTPVALSASADVISKLTAYGGACRGNACSFVLTEDAHVEARIDHRRYVVQDLGTLAGQSWSAAQAISKHARFIGGTSGGATPAQAFFYDGVMQAIGVGGDAMAVNDHGIIVGVHGDATSFKGYRWRGGTVTDLPSLGGAYTFAQGINDRDVIVGYSTRTDGQMRAVYWTSGAPVDLGSLGGGGYGCSYAYGINDDGIIVGESCIDGTGTRAVRFRNPGVIDDLGTLGGHFGRAHAISENGLYIVGESSVDDKTPQHGFFWRGGQMSDVGLLPGTDLSTLSGVNSQGIGVGVAFLTGVGNFRGILFAEGQLIDLNTLVDATPYTITHANAIDENGNIAGTGWDPVAWAMRAVILRPE
jgi:probable HAF family extracellular repeat protein